MNMSTMQLLLAIPVIGQVLEWHSSCSADQDHRDRDMANFTNHTEGVELCGWKDLLLEKRNSYSQDHSFFEVVFRCNTTENDQPVRHRSVETDYGFNDPDLRVNELTVSGVINQVAQWHRNCFEGEVTFLYVMESITKGDRKDFQRWFKFYEFPEGYRS